MTYYYVSGQGQEPQGSRGQWQSTQGAQRGYGTTNAGGMNTDGGSSSQTQGQSSGGAAEGSSAQQVPPSYEQAVKGDHKVQT